MLAQQKSGAAEQAFAQQLAAEAKKNGMQKTADAHGLHVTTTDYVGQGRRDRQPGGFVQRC